MNTPMNFSSADKRISDERIAAERKKRRQREDDDMSWVLSTPQGRRIVCEIFEETGVWRSCFHENAHVMSALEGKRDIGLLILTRVRRARPSALEQMQRENSKVNEKEGGSNV